MLRAPLGAWNCIHATWSVSLQRYSCGLCQVIHLQNVLSFLNYKILFKELNTSKKTALGQFSSIENATFLTLTKTKLPWCLSSNKLLPNNSIKKKISKKNSSHRKSLVPWDMIQITDMPWFQSMNKPCIPPGSKSSQNEPSQHCSQTLGRSRSRSSLVCIDFTKVSNQYSMKTWGRRDLGKEPLPCRFILFVH